MNRDELADDMPLGDVVVKMTTEEARVKLLQIREIAPALGIIGLRAWNRPAVKGRSRPPNSGRYSPLSR